MRADAHCRGCMRPIRWARTTGGKSMPIDPTPNIEHGNVWVVEWGPPGRTDPPVVAVAATPDGVPASEPLRYTSHFATCPHADEFRRRRRK